MKSARRPRTFELRFPVDPADAEKLGQERAVATAARIRAQKAQEAADAARDRLTDGDEAVTVEQVTALERTATDATEAAMAAEQSLEAFESTLAVLTVHVQATGGQVYERLVAAHPPTDDAPDGALWDPDTYIPARLSACICRIDYPDGTSDQAAGGAPLMTPDEISEWLESGVMNASDRKELIEAAQLVDLAVSLVQLERLGKG